MDGESSGGLNDCALFWLAMYIDPFLFFSTLCVLLVGRAVVQRRPIISFPIDYVLIGIVLGIAFLIRNNGALLIILVALTQLISTASGFLSRPDFFFTKHLSRMHDGPKTARKSLLIGLIPYATFFCLLGLLALWRPQLLFGGIPHLGVRDGVSLKGIIVNIVYNAHLPKGLFGSYMLYAASVPFVLIGVIRRYKRDYHILLYVVLMILLYVIWPGRQGLRYLFLLLPFYVSFLFTGLAASYRSSAIFGKRINPSYLIVAVVMTLLFFAEETSYRASKNVF